VALLSAAIIVRDEAEFLDACLASLHSVVDEIVVVDTGSSDDSVEVARRHGAVVGFEPWAEDFSTPRNTSLGLASGDWILYIDADERVRAGDHSAVRQLLADDTEHVSLRVPFVARVNWTPYREFRLWRHRPDIRFTGAIHESIVQAVTGVAQADGLRIGDLDRLTDAPLVIEHFGYEGDQSHKHVRNEPMLRAALATHPERIFLYDHLARTYEDLGHDERARATWRLGIEVARANAHEHPDNRLLWVNLINHSVARDDPDGDVGELLDEASARYPGNPAIEFAAASRELTSGQPADAARRFEALTQFDVEALINTGTAYDLRVFNEWSWHSLGLARFDLGDYAGAVEAFRRAEAADPENPAYRTRRQLAEARAAASVT
jgi:glycosyltransferase involved in cell wall biosynthesis